MKISQEEEYWKEHGKKRKALKEHLIFSEINYTFCILKNASCTICIASFDFYYNYADHICGHRNELKRINIKLP